MEEQTPAPYPPQTCPAAGRDHAQRLALAHPSAAARDRLWPAQPPCRDSHRNAMRPWPARTSRLAQSFKQPTLSAMNHCKIPRGHQQNTHQKPPPSCPLHQNNVGNCVPVCANAAPRCPLSALHCGDLCTCSVLFLCANTVHRYVGWDLCRSSDIGMWLVCLEMPPHWSAPIR